jgi:hypothetical protein
MKVLRFNQLNEAAKWSESPFITVINKKDIAIYNYNKTLYDSADGTSCIIYWDYELETSKKSGIQSITPIINYVVVEVEYEKFNESTDETEYIVESYEFGANDKIVTENLTNYTKIPYYPQEVEIDVKNNSIIIKF